MDPAASPLPADLHALSDSLSGLLDAADDALPPLEDDRRESDSWAHLAIHPDHASWLNIHGEMSSHARLALNDALALVQDGLAQVTAWPPALHDWSLEVTRWGRDQRAASGQLRLTFTTHGMSLTHGSFAPDAPAAVATALHRLAALPRREAAHDAWAWWQLQGFGRGQVIPALDADDARARFGVFVPEAVLDLNALHQIPSPFPAR